MKTQPTRCQSQPTKAPKGRVKGCVLRFYEDAQLGKPYCSAVLPCPSRKTAAALVKWHNLTREERVNQIDDMIKTMLPRCAPIEIRDAARAILDMQEGRA